MHQTFTVTSSKETTATKTLW